MKKERLQIVQILNETNKSLDVAELVRRSGLSRGMILGNLPRLCIDGLIDEQGGRYSITQKGRITINELEPVPENKSFHFFLEESEATGFVAYGLIDFFEIAQTIDIASLEFHSRRGDFSKWFKEVYNDEELAGAAIELTETNLSGEVLREKLCTRLNRTYKLLKTLLT